MFHYTLAEKAREYEISYNLYYWLTQPVVLGFYIQGIGFYIQFNKLPPISFSITSSASHAQYGL